MLKSDTVGINFYFSLPTTKLQIDVDYFTEAHQQ